jgi:hypothetical protein
MDGLGEGASGKCSTGGEDWAVYTVSPAMLPHHMDFLGNIVSPLAPSSASAFAVPIFARKVGV